MKYHRSDRRIVRSLLAAALLSSSGLVAVPAAAQTAAPAVPPPPAGGYYMADGTRTADYNAALESWRTDAQFSVDYTKRYLGLEYAYVLGLTGAGQTIGINDSGVLPNHPLFQGAGKLTGLRTVVPAAYGNDGIVNPRRPWEIHGTHVAGTAAGARIAGERMFGNAFGANIVSVTANFAAGDFLWWKDQILDGTTVSTPRDNIIDAANTGIVRIVNNSWGSGTSLPYTATLAQAKAAFAQNLNGFYDPVLANDVLVVFSAGNGGGVHASIDAVTPLNDMRLRSNWLSVANYRANGTAAPSTSFCGQTATWCVAGPGSSVISGVNLYTVNTAAIRAKYTPAMFAGIYSATTVAALNNAATNAWINVLVGYLTRKDAAEAAGVEFDEARERTFAAQQAVAISLAYGSRFVGGDPNGYTSTLANILTANVGLLTRGFSESVLVQADALITAELRNFISYGGPGYGALTGTSMAAPNVSGFAALLMEWFPEYNTGLISDILVSSSLDLDAAGVDLKSGWGAPQMGVALAGPTALRETRTVDVATGTVDLWTNDIQDARDRYSPEVLAGFPDDIGGLTKRGGGELILAGDNSYSGATRVEQGTLTVNGSLIRSALTAAGGGTIGGTGRLSSLAVASGGTVSPGAAGAIGTLNVSGAAVFTSGGQYLVDVGPNGASDRLVAGRAELGGTLTLRQAAGTLPRFGDAYTVLTTTDGGVTGTFANATSISAILFPELRYGANSVGVRVAARPYASVVAATPVQTAYASLLDNNRAAYSSLAGIYSGLDLASVDTIRGTLESLAPRAETTRRAIGTVALDNMARFYRERLASLRTDSFAGGSVAMIGKPLEFAANEIAMPGRASQVSDSPSTMMAEGVLPETVSAYLAGGYIDGSAAPMLGAMPAGGRDRFDGFYIVGGLEGQLGGNGVLGFGLSYSDIDGDRVMNQQARGELIQGTLYGKIGATVGASLDAQFSAGVYQSNVRRSGTFVGNAYDFYGRDDAFTLSTEVGASYNLGSEAFTFGPRAAIRASRIEFGKVAEQGGGGPALTIDGEKFDSFQLRGGVQARGNASGFRPFASAYVVHDLEDRPGVFRAGFLGGTPARAFFPTSSQDQTWGEVGGGIAFGSERFEFSIAADTTIERDDVRNQSYRAGVTVRF
ncbi:autotransporter domain-containing protein [Sphingomonas spermidinifaciens]|uniref:Autotransporter domain-containing protein n=1 Tax=Sphingomonas spermidinifaciens TaxID=1141889 RepID=A0A2A4B423_9SPHN|nr:S8 family serine peptidase [Sphingomonas spermidinifaciens]PCD02705.1 autotransporter domain-containing protein [Sphingomonas spermidinifaciens]